MSKQRTPISEVTDDQVRRARAAYEFNLKWARDNPQSRARPRPQPQPTVETLPPGRTLTESQVASVADQVLAKLENPAPAELTAAELAKLEHGSVERTNAEVTYWAGKMAGKSPFWS